MADHQNKEQIRFSVGPIDLRKISAGQMALLENCKTELDVLAVLGTLALGESGAVPPIDTWTPDITMGPRC